MQSFVVGMVCPSAANDTVTILVTKGVYDNFVALLARMRPVGVGDVSFLMRSRAVNMGWGRNRILAYYYSAPL